MACWPLQKLAAIRSNAMKQILTYNVPHVLLDYKAGDFPSATIREGGSRQIEHTITVEFVESAVDESDKVFATKAKNQINFGGNRLDVLNDEIPNIAPSAPTASEYMSKVGKEVLVGFNCSRSDQRSREEKKDIFRVIRTTIILP